MNGGFQLAVIHFADQNFFKRHIAAIDVATNE
jgi:hypothetical protein